MTYFVKENDVFQYEDLDNISKKLSTLLFLLIIYSFKKETIMIYFKYVFFIWFKTDNPIIKKTTATNIEVK